MSYNNRRNSTPSKPFCKVCKDAGKSESDYTSHHVRSLPDKQGNTKVTCPTLLNTECRYCYELGHTAKFCPTLANRQKADERNRREEIRSARAIQKPVQKPTPQKNTYSVLFDSDDEAEPKPVVEEFPALCAPSQRVVTGSYASAAAKPVPIIAAKPALPTGFQVLQKGAAYEKTETPKPTLVPRKITSWADDSSDEEDEEVEHVDNSAW